MSKIDEFIQEDTLVYLDKHLENTVSKAGVVDDDVYLSRDYEEELLSALDTNNIKKAKEVLHSLKDKFDEVPVGTPEKSRMKFILQSMYDKFKEHIESSEVFEEMDDKLSEMSGSPTTHKKHKPKELPKISSEKPSLEDHANGTLDTVETYLATGNVEKAVTSYRDARKDLLHMEVSVPNVLAKRFTDVYTRIAETMKERKQDHSAALDKNILMQIEREKQALDEGLHAHDMRAAIHRYKNMRLLVQQLRHKKTAEVVAKKLLRIYGIIQTIGEHGQVSP